THFRSCQASAPAVLVHAPGHGIAGPDRLAAFPDGPAFLGAGVVVRLETGPRPHHAPSGADRRPAGLDDRLFLAARHDLQPQYGAALVDHRFGLAVPPAVGRRPDA